ncbi:N-acetylglucosamine-6-phosphate deacetylase [Filobacillus milosensis]|uniref:N-acetylglucosamine-6-phosphate deacetylase n=1 Tax=Filobacillus milosensis TaxID=94137 RepID=A0A4Y8IY94_9BACI|nr:N-acetylglucosamine-6-phosphate deacetylase [Filobacillus milosensis]
MGLRTLIKNINIYTEFNVLKNSSLVIDEGVIESIGEDCVDGYEIDGEGLNLVPGFIEGHIHGADGFDVMDGTDEALSGMARFLPKEGTTSFVATTITSDQKSLEQVIQQVSQYQGSKGEAEVLGLHIEGPFVEPSKAGAQPKDFILKPDLDLMKHWVSLAQGKIKTVTMAPELDPDGQLINYLVENGINVSAGHTNANFADIIKAVKQGVSQMTHLCNAMNGIHHREIGAVGAAFLLEGLTSEVIADGVHLSKDMLKLLYQSIGPERLMLITDSMRAKGKPDGTYTLGGQKVTVSNGMATLDDGTLAGSILTMDQGVRNMLNETDATLKDVIQMASVNPAKQLGIFNRKGSIQVGKDADLLMVDDSFNIIKTYSRGVSV